MVASRRFRPVFALTLYDTLVATRLLRTVVSSEATRFDLLEKGFGSAAGSEDGSGSETGSGSAAAAGSGSADGSTPIAGKFRQVAVS